MYLFGKSSKNTPIEEQNQEFLSLQKNSEEGAYSKQKGENVPIQKWIFLVQI